MSKGCGLHSSNLSYNFNWFSRARVSTDFLKNALKSKGKSVEIYDFPTKTRPDHRVHGVIHDHKTGSNQIIIQGVKEAQKTTPPLFRQNMSRVSAVFVGRFRFSHSLLLNQNEEIEVKVFRCGLLFHRHITWFSLKFLSALVICISFYTRSSWRHLSPCDGICRTRI